MNRKKDNIIVGFVVLLALFVLLAGTFFLKGAAPGRSFDSYFVMFPQVSTLSEGDPVKINGVKMGKVEEISLEKHQVKVHIKLNSGVKLPIDSRVRVQNIGLMGERQVGITLGETEKTFQPGAVLDGAFDAGIAEAMGTAGEVFEEAQILVKETRELIQKSLGDSLFLSNLQGAVQNARVASEKSRELISDLSPDLKSALNDVRVASEEIKNFVETQKKPLETTIQNGKEVSERLVTLSQTADEVSKELELVLEKLNQGQGTLGALLSDSTFHRELRSTLNSADSLFQRIRASGLDVNIDFF